MQRTARRQLDARFLVDAFLRLPRSVQLALVGVAAVGALLYFSGAFQKSKPAGQPTLGETGELTPVNLDTPGTREVFFAFWNVENLFDDKNDKRRSVDEEYDNPFADNAELRQLKLDRLATAILKMNDGKGPDVLACCEVESVRALELLQGTLNAKITDPKLKYVSLAMKNLDGGRHIAPGVVSRFPLSQQRTRMLETKSRLRILETHLFVNGHDLCIVASHWTSKLRQDDGGTGEAGREKYARGIYDYYKSLADKNADTDFLVCGDFNETPDAKELTFDLGAIGDIKKVKAGGEFPPLLSLMAGKTADKFGTIYYNKPLIYDHVCVSRGLLDDAGWSCDPDSIKTVTDGLIRTGATRREPWRFGDPDRNLRDSERGYSDHFPLTVKLTVRPATPTKQ
jgi:endonuclease/exonuclease/phosphatase family metal-dependent hydrolase